MPGPRDLYLSVKKGALFLSRPDVPFFILPALMFVLVAGTVAQRYMGLYDAQKHFFSSVILWAGPVPLPGGFALCALLGLSLLCKFLFFSPWRRARVGINLAHLGVLVLLAGGLLTALRAQEGAMVIPEGGSSATVEDYHDRELTVTRDGVVTDRLPFATLRPGASFALGGETGLRLEILSACRNCRIERRAAGDNATYRSIAQFMELHAQRPEKEAENNLPGVTFRLSGAGADADGIYIAFDPMPKPLTVAGRAGPVDLMFGRARRVLPFTLSLTDFTEENYPGTAMPRAYTSRLVLRDGGVEWPVTVAMNQPLRYKGYTFFQSSFARRPDGDESTVLSVVDNDGWLFPYIGTGLMAAGLLIHLVILMRRRGAA